MPRLLLLAALSFLLGATPPLPHEVTVSNDTGMILMYLYAAGCTESEGEDWDAMADWATDYLGDDILLPDDRITLDLDAGCYVLLPVWDDGTEIREQLLVEGDMTHHLTLG